MFVALPLSDLVWSAAFHSFGAISFAIVAAVVLVETWLLRLVLRTPWDDTAGAVFLGHVTSLLAAIVLGVGFTDTMRTFVSGTLAAIDTWSDLAALPTSFAGMFFAGAREVLAWPTGGTIALLSAVGFSCLAFVVVARSILRVAWNWRTASALLAVSLFTALGVVVSIWLRTRPEVVPEAI